MARRGQAVRSGREECAARVIETIPLLMRTLGAEPERRGHRGMSMRWQRTLRFISLHRGANLTDLCRFLDASLSAGSKLVDGLVRDGLLAAEASAADRRVKRISITGAGRRALAAIDRQLGVLLSERLAGLSDGDCATIGAAMEALRSVFQAPIVQPKERSRTTDEHQRREISLAWEG